MKFQMIDRKEAPVTAKPSQSKMMNESMELINALSKGKVARIDLEEGASARGVKSSLSRAAKKLNKPVRNWQVNETIFVELAG